MKLSLYPSPHGQVPLFLTNHTFSKGCPGESTSPSRTIRSSTKTAEEMQAGRCSDAVEAPGCSFSVRSSVEVMGDWGDSIDGEGVTG